MGTEVLQRFLAVGESILERFAWNASEVKPTKMPKQFRQAEFLAAWQATEHSVIQVGQRLHCQLCGGRSTGSRVAWLATPCTDKPGNTAAGGPHPTHQLRRTDAMVMYCGVCGVWAKTRRVLICKPCPGRLRSALHGYALMRMQCDQAPLPPRKVESMDSESDGLELVAE